MGYRILLTLMETQTAAGFHRFQMNYLVNVPPSIYEQYFSEKIPLQLKGSEFIRRYHCIDDHATEIVPDKLYSVRQPTAHPIYEHFRVRNFTELVQKPMTDIVLELLGEFMFQSHSSYSACGLGSKATDRIVELDREFGARGGLFGAKITGGGSGGTVVLLGRAAASESIEGIVEKYSSETGFKPYVFSGSSMGASEFGYLKLDNIVQ